MYWYKYTFQTAYYLIHALIRQSIPEIPDASMEQGVLPKLLATLVQRRREVKNLIKSERDPAKLSEYDIRQRALKLTANRYVYMYWFMRCYWTIL